MTQVVQDAFYWAADVLMPRIEEAFARGQRKYGFSVAHSDYWNLFDVKSWITDAGYVYHHDVQQQRIIVAKNMHDLLYDLL